MITATGSFNTQGSCHKGQLPNKCAESQAPKCQVLRPDPYRFFSHRRSADLQSALVVRRLNPRPLRGPAEIGLGSLNEQMKMAVHEPVARCRGRSHDNGHRVFQYATVVPQRPATQQVRRKSNP